MKDLVIRIRFTEDADGMEPAHLEDSVLDHVRDYTVDRVPAIADVSVVGWAATE
jgi:hypothetical protein